MKWVGRFMARRAEDYLRKATGMPPRPGSRQARKESRRTSATGGSRQSSSRQAQSGYGYYDPDGPIIPKEYAEDVEFVETKDYSETTIGSFDDSRRNTTFYRESQVSDVEWEEIKTGKKRKD